MSYTTNEKIPKLRADAVRMVRSGKSTREVARYYGYNQSSVASREKTILKDGIYLLVRPVTTI